MVNCSVSQLVKGIDFQHALTNTNRKKQKGK